MAAAPIIPRVRADEAPVETLFDELPLYRAGKYLTFRVARLDFAMYASYVCGILPMHELTALEIAHEWICGFATVRGRDFPVVDLRAKLGIAHGSHGREPFIIVVQTEAETGGRLVGFVADRVSELLDLRQRDFRNGALRGHGRPRRVLEPGQIMKEEDWSALWVKP
jgi:chemotaxis signal transduction protein